MRALIEAKELGLHCADRSASPKILSSIKLKELKYSVLVLIGEDLFRCGKLPSAPEFVVAAMTDFGEMSAGFFKLVERLVAAARLNPDFHPQVTGFSAKEMSARVRRRVKDAFISSCIRGVGRRLALSGLIFRA